MGRDLFSFFSGSVCFFFAALFVGPSIAFCFWFRLGNLFFVFFFPVFLLLCFVCFICFFASLLRCFSFFCFLFFFVSVILLRFSALLFLCFLFLCFFALVLYTIMFGANPIFHLCNVPFFAGQYLPCLLEFHQILVRQSQSYPHFPIISHYMPLY